MSTCTRCKNEAEVGGYNRRLCLRCHVVNELLATQERMHRTGMLMIQAGGEVEEHGRQMLGAARIINSWMDGISEMQRKGAG